MRMCTSVLETQIQLWCHSELPHSFHMQSLSRLNLRHPILSSCSPIISVTYSLDPEALHRIFLYLEDSIIIRDKFGTFKQSMWFLVCWPNWTVGCQNVEYVNQRCFYVVSMCALNNKVGTKTLCWVRCTEMLTISVSVDKHTLHLIKCIQTQNHSLIQSAIHPPKHNSTDIRLFSLCLILVYRFIHGTAAWCGVIACTPPWLNELCSIA